ncbi:MAG: hypothetical protein WCF18_21845 [Chthoniobacteraceae bacterium]
MHSLRLLLVPLAAWLALSLAAFSRDFDLRRDTFAFSNDTVLRYGVDEAGRLHISRRDKPVEYGHRCFVLARAVLQFHQFARFEPHQPKLSREEYHRRIRQLCRIPVWSSGPRERIVFPGFADVHAFSIAYEGLLKEDLGNWLPCYLRVGNWRMATGHLRAGQAAAARWLSKSMEERKLRALYLARFPSMNHVVVVYAMHPQSNGDIRFDVYDPNYPNEPSWLLYRADQRSFEFDKRWYFPGGRVNVMRIYISPFH